MGSCPQATPQHTGEEEEEEEGPAPAAVGLGARLCRSPAASYPKQPLKKKAGQELEGPPPGRKGTRATVPAAAAPMGTCHRSGDTEPLGNSRDPRAESAGSCSEPACPESWGETKGALAHLK